MFITNSHSSFHLWSKENLVKHQKVSKYYEHDCRLPICWLNSTELSMLLLTSLRIVIQTRYNVCFNNRDNKVTKAI